MWYWYIPTVARWQELTSGKETIWVDILESQIPQYPPNYIIALHVETTRKVLSINISFIVISQQSIVGLLSISELLASGDYERVWGFLISI
jgi:hypothetical protein